MGALAAGDLAFTIGAAQHNRETIIRIRGTVAAFIDGTQANGIGAIISMGICVVPEGTGTTVLWSPETDVDAPWMWYDTFLLAYEEMVTDVVDVPLITGYRTVIDSKSMRRIRNSELQLVVSNATFSSTLSINVFIGGCCLSQE